MNFELFFITKQVFEKLFFCTEISYLFLTCKLTFPLDFINHKCTIDDQCVFNVSLNDIEYFNTSAT